MAHADDSVKLPHESEHSLDGIGMGIKGQCKQSSTGFPGRFRCRCVGHASWFHIVAETMPVVAPTDTEPPHRAAHWTGHTVEREVAAGRAIPVVLDKLRHRQASQSAVLSCAPSASNVPLLPTTASSPNAVENLLSMMTRQHIRHGVFASSSGSVNYRAAINAMSPCRLPVGLTLECHSMRSL
jgi:hypothetical protein